MRPSLGKFRQIRGTAVKGGRDGSRINTFVAAKEKFVIRHSDGAWTARFAG
jgi:hypothetical protein